MAGSSGEKTEAPTPKKKREARRDGQIPRSAEITSWTALLMCTWLVGATMSSAGRLLHRLVDQFEAAFGDPDPARAMAMLGDGLLGSVMAVAPLAIGMLAVGVIGNLAQVGWAPTTKALKPQAKRLNPIAGLKKVFGPHSLWEAGKASLKLALLVGVSWKPLSEITAILVGNGATALADVVAIVAASGTGLARRIAMAGLVLAAVDYAMQRRRIGKALKMTKQEVKDEGKQSDGNPQMKGEIRSRQLAMSRNRMLAELPKADVVLVNPTHVAVALKYDPTAGAPRVVAKGADAVATRIREIAAEHGVPLVTDIPLARTLHKLCNIGDEIPADMYEAVARVLAFVFAIKARMAAGGGRRPLPLPQYVPTG